MKEQLQPIRRWLSFQFAIIGVSALFGLTSLFLLIVSLFVWQSSQTVEINSAALQERRSYTVYMDDRTDRIIYSLDGQNYRHSPFPATIFAIAAWVKGEKPPVFVAIHSGPTRDVDFRNAQSNPASWRPSIAGRAARFDRFLVGELVPQVESGREGWRTRRYGLGHSLAGLYMLDLTSRKAGLFNGVYVFSPTFSHDLSIVPRLAASCLNSREIYANIGLESERDTAVFARSARRWADRPGCHRNALHLRRHYGVPHQLIMMTGQIESAFFYFP